MTHSWNGSDTTLLVVVIVLLVFSGFFALAETSLVRMTRTRAEALKAEGRRGATTLARLVQSPDHFLNPLLLLILVCQLVSATLVGVLAERLFGTSGLIISTIFEVVVIFVLFEAIPKNFAVMHGNKSALLSAPVVNALLGFWPIKWISAALLATARLALKPFGGGDANQKVTEQEILAVTTVAHEDAEIARDEALFIRRVLEMDETVAREVMTPRTDMVDVSSDTTVREALETAIQSGRSRLPVLGEDVDDIVGFVTLRFLAEQFVAGRGDETVAAVGVKKAVFFPETKKVRSLLFALKRGKSHLAIVVDEYGGTAGIVTLEDILEEVVGQIMDEDDTNETYDETEVTDEEVKPKPPTWPKVISARLHIDDANETHGLALPDTEWDTVGGWVLYVAGGLPTAGETFISDGYEVTVLEVEGRRIEEVSINLHVEHE